MWVGVDVLGVGYGIGGCVVKNIFGGRGVPRFALEYVELVWGGYHGFAGFPYFMCRAGYGLGF